MRLIRKRWIWLKRWLRKEPANQFIIALLIVDCAASMFIAAFIGLMLFWSVIPRANILNNVEWTLNLLLGAFIEEVIFRWLPLLMPLIALKKKQAHLFILLLISAIASFFFGIAHGGLYNLPIQGVGGFILCLFFIKCSYVDGKTDSLLQPRALVVTTFAHFLYNFLVLTVL